MITIQLRILKFINSWRFVAVRVVVEYPHKGTNLYNIFIVLLAFLRFVYTDSKSAFTVKGHYREEGAYGNIVFVDRGVISNIGGHYSPVTGQFTCQYPGVYVFSLNLYKDSDEVSAHCDIRLNGVSQIFVYASYSKGSHEGSSSVVLHLIVADTVDIGSCTSLATIDPWTNFNGFLLYPD